MNLNQVYQREAAHANTVHDAYLPFLSDPDFAHRIGLNELKQEKDVPFDEEGSRTSQLLMEATVRG